MNTIPFRKLSNSELAACGVESGPAPWAPSSPSTCSPVSTLSAALYMYRDKFGKKAEPNMGLEPTHWPITRPRDEETAEMVE
jgi:hypothetical protein